MFGDFETLACVGCHKDDVVITKLMVTAATTGDPGVPSPKSQFTYDPLNRYQLLLTDDEGVFIAAATAVTVSSIDWDAAAVERSYAQGRGLRIIRRTNLKNDLV